MGRVREKRRVEERRSEKRKSQKKEDAADARKGRKVAKCCVFPMICRSRGSKSRLAKADGAEPSGQMRDEKLHAVVARSTFASEKAKKHLTFGPLLEVAMPKKCTLLWHEAHLQVKKVKTRHVRTTFGSCDVEKVHAVVARSTFASEKAKKHLTFGPLLEVAMPKKCTLLWHEAHLQVKKVKARHVRTTFGSCDVEKVHAVVARSTFASEKGKNTARSDHFWKLRCRKSGRRGGAKNISKSKCRKHQGFGPLLDVQMCLRVAGARDCRPCQK